MFNLFKDKKRDIINISVIRELELNERDAIIITLPESVNLPYELEKEYRDAIKRVFVEQGIDNNITVLANGEKIDILRPVDKDVEIKKSV